MAPKFALKNGKVYTCISKIGMEETLETNKSFMCHKFGT